MEIQKMVNDLLDYRYEKEIIYASHCNNNGKKELGFKGDGSFFVKFNGKFLLKSNQPFPCVEKYLSISL